MERRPLVGVGAIIVRGDEVLLVRRHGVHGAGTWSTPGGYLEYGEAPEDCAAREALEETGVVGAGFKFRALTHDPFPEAGKHFITIWMEGGYQSGEARVAAPEELAEVGWFRWDALPPILFPPFARLVAGNCYR